MWITTAICASIILLYICEIKSSEAVQAFTDKTTSVWTGYFGLDPPSLVPEAGELPSCYEHSKLALNSNCTVYTSDSLPLIVRSCPLSWNSGQLFLQRNNSAANLTGVEYLGMAVYRVRVLGPSGIWLLEPRYCTPDRADTMYSLSLPGRYSIEVLMMYTSFSYTDIGKSKPVLEPWAGYLTLEISPEHNVFQRWSLAPDHNILSPDGMQVAGAAGAGGVLQAGAGVNSTAELHSVQDEVDEGALPLCPYTGLLPGRWRFREWPPPLDARELLRTCLWGNTTLNCLSEERAPLREQPHPATLYWQPHGCRLRPVAGLPEDLSDLDGGLQRKQQLPGAQQQQLRNGEPSPITPESCLRPGRHVCFLGDSHMRYLYNSLNIWWNGFTIRAMNDRHQALPSNMSSYWKVLWGNDWPRPDRSGADRILASNCTDVLANFGQWPASFQAGTEPRSAESYVQTLLKVRHKLRELRDRGLRVFWITTSQPSLKTYHELAGIDWRTEPVLLLYNRLAIQVMSDTSPGLNHGVSTSSGLVRSDHGEQGGRSQPAVNNATVAPIPIIDTWSSSSMLSELTRDGSHFQNHGMVGLVVLAAALRALCAE